MPVHAWFITVLLWRSLMQRKKYPLLLLSARSGGFFKTISLLRKVKLTKILTAGGYCHFTLVGPRWPSRVYDRCMATGGLNLASAGTQSKAQIDLVHCAISSRCTYRCPHCYERHNLCSRETVPVEQWIKTTGELQDAEAHVIVLSGGEPLMRFEECITLLDSADKERSDFHIHTTGYGLSSTRVKALIGAGVVAAGVGLDDFDKNRMDTFRGHEGAFNTAVRALHLFADAGILTYVNFCLTPSICTEKNLWRFYEFVAQTGAVAIQMLEPLPCGGYRRNPPDELFPARSRTTATTFFHRTYRRKWSRYPAVFYDAYLESPEHLGCRMGGLSHLHIDCAGNVKPCVFLHVSFGNIREHSFGEIYAKMRQAIPFPLHARCPAASLAKTIHAVSVQTGEYPVRYESIESQWHEMYRNASMESGS
jgi:MoaA/NifB/PqqE/SkfB family radical SAM enzyme